MGEIHVGKDSKFLVRCAFFVVYYWANFISFVMSLLGEPVEITLNVDPMFRGLPTMQEAMIEYANKMQNKCMCHECRAARDQRPQA
jgi:hypothetical protein